MNSPLIELGNALSDWVAAGDVADMPTPRSVDVKQNLLNLRASPEWSAASDTWIASADDLLAALSLLSNELMDSKEASSAVLEEAAKAFELLRGYTRSDDQFGEVDELRCRFAFVAWRHARALRARVVAQLWLERFDQHARRGSVDQECTLYFLSTPACDRSAELNGTFLQDSESLFSICSAARGTRNSAPSRLALELPSLYEWVAARFSPESFPDERNYFLAQLETSMGVCARWLGHREKSLAWLRRAEEQFQNTVEPDTGVAEVEFCRLTTLYDMGRYSEVVGALPALQDRMRTLGMTSALVKSEMLMGSTLKCMGRVGESAEPLERIVASPVLDGDVQLRAFVLEFLADSYTLQGRFAEAAECAAAVLPIVERGKVPTALAFLKLVSGESLRIQGQFEAAIEAFRGALRDYKELGLESYVAYARLMTAESLLALGRDRDAENEILEALPTIESLGLDARRSGGDHPLA